MTVKIEHCTSCGSKDIEVAGNKYLCRVCNVVYEVTDVGTKVVEADPLSKDREQIKRLCKDVDDLKRQGGRAAAPQNEPEETEPGDDDEEETDNDDEEGGFISWGSDEG